MKYQSLFSVENKKNISKCGMLKILPSMLSIKAHIKCFTFSKTVSNKQLFFFSHLLQQRNYATEYTLVLFYEWADVDNCSPVGTTELWNVG